MPVDTNEKKLSLINFGSPWVDTLPVGDGSLDTGDKLHLVGLYSGIEPAGIRVYGPVMIVAKGFYQMGAKALGFFQIGAKAVGSYQMGPVAQGSRP